MCGGSFITIVNGLLYFLAIKLSPIELPIASKSALSCIAITIFLALFIGWAYLVYSDYGRVKNSEEPKYCVFGTNVDDSDDGTITECIGLGYKVINYKTLDVKMTEFVPVWEKTKTLAELEEK